MGRKYNHLITASSGFTYNTDKPLDDRAVVDYYDDLAALVSEGASYEGMEVYVVANKKSYKRIGDEWKAVTTEDTLAELISCGTADPDTTTTSQFYFKYDAN